MKNTELEAIIEKYDLVGKNREFIIGVLLENHPSKGALNNLKLSCEILDYINQHYAIKPDVMRELKKEENVRRILEGGNDLSKELYLTCEDTPYNVVVRVDDFEAKTGTGQDTYGNWNVKYNNWSWLDYPQYWRKSTPEEIQSMLVKKLEAEGLKVGCMVETLNKVNYQHDCENEFVYQENHDRLYLGNWIVYDNGQFAKIIPPELTIEQKMEILWNERNAKLI